MRSILSVDIDLNRHHMWSNRDNRVAYNATDIDIGALASHDLILVEVASNIFYKPKGIKRHQEKAMMVRKTAWMIYNTYFTGVLYHKWLDVRLSKDSQFLVAPSSEWTKKYTEEVRQKMAGVDGQDNHDIRECRTMQFFYSIHPKPWIPYHEYFKSFTFKETE